MQPTNKITAEEMTAIPAIELSEIRKGKKPLVSVIMLAYNHETYIREAVESIVKQDADFDFELLIGEDASTDATLAVCKELQQANHHIIRLVTSADNVGMHRNFARLWCRAEGEYIAFCEGDDYWIDSKKLNKQVDFLTANFDFSLCGTYTQPIQQNTQNSWNYEEVIKPEVVKNKYSFAELIPRYNFHFSSVMVRKNAIEFPAWFWDVYCVDRPLYLIATERKSAGLIPEITSIYRRHSGGNWFPLDLERKAQSSIHLFQSMKDHFDRRHIFAFEQTLGDILLYYTTKSLHEGQRSTAKNIFRETLKYRKTQNLYELYTIVRVALQLYLHLPLADNCKKLRDWNPLVSPE